MHTKEPTQAARATRPITQTPKRKWGLVVTSRWLVVILHASGSYCSTRARGLIGIWMLSSCSARPMSKKCSQYNSLASSEKRTCLPSTYVCRHWPFDQLTAPHLFCELTWALLPSSASRYTLLSYKLNQNPLRPGIIPGPACNTNTTGLVQIPGLENGSIVALGALGRYMIVLPKSKTVVVSMSSNSALDTDLGSCPGGNWAQPATTLLSQLWLAIGDAVTARKDSTNSAAASSTDGAASTRSSIGVNHTLPRTDRVSTRSVPTRPTSAGACYCYCPRYQGIGKCSSHVVDKETCLAPNNTVDAAADIFQYCPNISMVYDCFRPSLTCPPEFQDNMGPAVQMHLDPRRSTSCGTATAPALTKFSECNYFPVSYRSCFWVPNARCEFSPFFPAFAGAGRRY
jgi:hypothetical protein